VVEIARRLGRTADAVDARRRLVGLAPRRRPREWSARQDALLLASLRAGVPARIVAERLGLPLEAVRRRRRVLAPARAASRRWTLEEDERLRAALATGSPLGELACELARSEGALRTRARERELLPQAERRRRWTPAEDDLVRFGYESGRTCHAIATDLLGGARTPETVSARARKLGLATYARTWTDEEDRTLRQLGLSGACVSEAAELLARTPEAIRRRSRELGIRLASDPVRGSPRPWRTEEDALLRELAGLHPARLARILGRSDQTIRRRRAALGINNRSPHHLPPAHDDLTPGERRLLAREYSPEKPRWVLALAHRLGRTPAELRARRRAPCEQAMIVKTRSQRPLPGRDRAPKHASPGLAVERRGQCGPAPSPATSNQVRVIFEGEPEPERWREALQETGFQVDRRSTVA
jgi:hypothetical protein